RASLLRAQLVARNLGAGEEALAAHRTTQALAAFSRALALDPSNQEASSQVQRIHRRARTVRIVRRSALGASLAVLVGVGGTRAGQIFRAWQKPPPPPAAVVNAPRAPPPTAPAEPPAETGEEARPEAPAEEEAETPPV